MTVRTDSQIEYDATSTYQAAYTESLHQYEQDGDHAAFTARNRAADETRKAEIAPPPRKEPPMKSTTEAAPKHGALPLYWRAGDCAHPEPGRDGPGWDEWDAGHPDTTEGDRLCELTPAGTYCPACTEKVVGGEPDPLTDEYVTCREGAATTGTTK